MKAEKKKENNTKIIVDSKMSQSEENRQIMFREGMIRLNCIKVHFCNSKIDATAKETLMYRTVLWTLWERERVGRFGRMALKHVKYHV